MKNWSLVHLEYFIFHNWTNSGHEHDSQMWLTVGKRGRGRSSHYNWWFQTLICLMWYDILPRWLLVSFIHINERHQLADWDEFPLSFHVLRQWNPVAIINQGHLSIPTCPNQPHQNYMHGNVISIRKAGSMEQKLRWGWCIPKMDAIAMRPVASFKWFLKLFSGFYV